MKTLDSYSPLPEWKTLEDSFNQDSGSSDSISPSKGDEILLVASGSTIYIKESDSQPADSDFGIAMQAGQSVYYTVSSNPLYVRGTTNSAKLVIHLN